MGASDSSAFRPLGHDSRYDPLAGVLTEAARDDLGAAVCFIALEGQNPEAALRASNELRVALTTACDLPCDNLPYNECCARLNPRIPIAAAPVPSFQPHFCRPMKRCLLAFAGLLSASLASAADTTSQVQQLFDQKCAECHFPSTPGRKGKKPTLDRQTTLRTLITENYVDPGNPDRSELFTVVTKPADDEERMPKSTSDKPVPPLNAAEKDLLRRWISENGVVATAAKNPNRPFVPLQEIHQAIIADLSRQTVPASYRYLSLTNLWNLGAANQPDADFTVYRAAITKLINSLSWAPRAVAPEFIGPHQLVARIKLSDYGWSSAMWDFVAARFPYQIDLAETAPKLAALTGSRESPVLRADWFVFVCSQSPLYEHLLFRSRLPGIRDAHMDADLEAALGVDLNRQLKDQAAAPAATGDLRAQLLGARAAASTATPQVVRAAFSVSGVSGANRLIDRHAFGTDSYYWKSYDFRVSKQQGGDLTGDLKRRPLGPGTARLTDNAEHVFEHDGGEVIFSLPNGLQGYLLFTAAGKFLSRAPSDVVQDANRKDAAILNGISCIRCHESGMQMPPGTTTLATSDIRNVLQANLARFSPREQQAIQSLYVSDEVLTRSLRADSEKFQRALRSIGIGRFDVEPVGYLYERFRRPIRGDELLAELDIDAAKVDLQPGRASARVAEILLKSRSDLVRTKAPLLAGAGIPRAEFIPIFAGVFAELAGAGATLRSAVALPVEEFNNVVLPNDGGGEFPDAKRAEFLRQGVTAAFLNTGQGSPGAPGRPGKPGNPGPAGAVGEGSLGGSSGRRGQPGGHGETGGNGNRGGDGATASITVTEFTFQRAPRIARIEIRSATHGEKTAHWDLSAPLVLNFRGGHGGEGGRGGDGGPGGDGGDGQNGNPADRDIFRRGGDGGDGGNGGNYGRGGTGGAGGNGGTVTLSIVGSADFIALVRQLLRIDVAPGAAGANGFNGDPGPAGSGGARGRGSPSGKPGEGGKPGRGASTPRATGYGSGAPGKAGSAVYR